MTASKLKKEQLRKRRWIKNAKDFNIVLVWMWNCNPLLFVGQLDLAVTLRLSQDVLLYEV